MRNMDIYRAYLAARDLTEATLIAYVEDLHANPYSVTVRLDEVKRQLRDVADKLGFEVVERAKQEAAE